LEGKSGAKGITFETHVKVIWRNPKGKIIKIDKARGVDPMLERWTHIGSEPVGSDFKKAARERAPLPVDPRRSYGPMMSEGCPRLPRCVVQHRHPAHGKDAGMHEDRQKESWHAPETDAQDQRDALYGCGTVPPIPSLRFRCDRPNLVAFAWTILPSLVRRTYLLSPR
jgi:hypothetical protein